jgi:hypothetical protein
MPCPYRTLRVCGKPAFPVFGCGFAALGNCRFFERLVTNLESSSSFTKRASASSFVLSAEALGWLDSILARSSRITPWRGLEAIVGVRVHFWRDGVA